MLRIFIPFVTVAKLVETGDVSYWVNVIILPSKIVIGSCALLPYFHSFVVSVRDQVETYHTR
jgi:hypothetical protein